MSLGLNAILAGQGDISKVALTPLPPLCVFQVVRRFCGRLAVELVGVLVDGLDDKLLLSRLLVSPATLTQSQKNPVSASAMLTGKFLRIRKVFATSLLFAGEFPDILENVRIIYKISR